jgi:hypothetical protein
MTAALSWLCCVVNARILSVCAVPVTQTRMHLVHGNLPLLCECEHHERRPCCRGQLGRRGRQMQQQPGHAASVDRLRDRITAAGARGSGSLSY